MNNIDSLIEIAASLNDSYSIEHNPEYLRGQVELIANASGSDNTELATQTIEEDITQRVRLDQTTIKQQGH